jgi:hypothetical protein
VNTGTASYFDDDDVHNKTTAPLTTVIMFLLLLGILFKVFYVIFDVVKSDNRLSTGFKLKISVMCL